MRGRVLALAGVLPLLAASVAGAAGNGVAAEWVPRWRADLAFACREMPLRHANLFHTLSREAFEAECRQLQEDVPGLSPADLVVRLAALVASIGDGHSRLTLPLDPAAGFFSGHSGTPGATLPSFRHYPLRLERLVDGYVVTRVGPGLERLLGARATAIDAQPLSAVEAAVAPIVNRDNVNQLHDLLPMFLVIPELLAARGVVADVERCRWSFERSDGVAEAVSLAPVARGVELDWKRLEPRGGQPLYRQHPGRAHWFQRIGEGRTVYVRLAEIADAPDRTLEQLADELLAEVRQRSASRLVLDLRGNPGGDNTLNAPLVRALIRAEPLWEPGALFVVTDGGTFSAAMNLASDLERLTPALFVGTGTGGRPNHYGDSRKLLLPETGLTIRLSSLYWQDSAPTDTRDAIEPLLPAEPTIADAVSGRDPALERILALAEPPGPLPGRWRGRLAIETLHASLELALGDDARTGELSLRSLGVEAAPLAGAAAPGGIWRGRATLSARAASLALRVAGERMVGWIDYRGRLYPFAAERER